jgi:hypothetical protein
VRLRDETLSLWISGEESNNTAKGTFRGVIKKEKREAGLVASLLRCQKPEPICFGTRLFVVVIPVLIPPKTIPQAQSVPSDFRPRL